MHGAIRAGRDPAVQVERTVDAHTRARLVEVLEREGLDALVVTTPENLFYVTGFRSISHALFRGAEYYGVFTRRGTGLVTPFIDATGIATEPVAADRVAVYGRFVFEYAEDPQAYGRRVRELTAAPKASAVEALGQVLSDLGALAFGAAVSSRTRRP